MIMGRFGVRLTICTAIFCFACGSGDDGPRGIDPVLLVERAMNFESLRADLEGITALGHRMAGTPNEVRARDFMIERFESIGLENVRTETFPYIQWSRCTCSLDVLEPEAFSPEARALGFSPDTCPGGLEGEVVFVGSAMPADYEALSPEDYAGKIHLATSGGSDLANRTIQYISARLHHASGFIHMKHRMGESGEPLIEIGSTHYVAGIPAVAIDHEAGVKLRSWLDRGAAPRVMIEVDAEQTVSTSWNVIGEIPGTSSERVTLGAHYDSWDVGPSAIDNGSGTAAMLEIARVMAALGPHGRTVRFVAFGAEELGIQGSIAYGLRHLADIRRLCRLMINIDIVGTTHGALSLTAVSPELRERVDDLIEETRYTQRTGYEAALAEFPNLGTDSTPFIVLGVPTLSSGKFPYIYYHTEFDTIVKVDWSDLYATVLLNAMAAFHYANA